MRLLLDTHAAAWWWLGNSRLPRFAIETVASASEVYVSAVSAFEISTKHRLAKWPEVGPLLMRLSSLMDESRFLPLPVTFMHTQTAGALASPHRDPFDRLLVAQSQLEGLTIITADPAISQFGVPVLWKEPLT